jgi:hypothetical protein
MKKNFIVLPLLLVFIGCDLFNTSEPEDTGSIQDGDMSVRQFYAADFIKSGSYLISAQKLAVGTKSIIYCESGASVSITQAKLLAKEFDERIYPSVTENFGESLDIDGNGKVIILLLDIRDGATRKEDGYTAGYFWAVNMYRKSSNAYSNEADMLYVDTFPGVVGDEQCLSTMAHEFQHLVNCSNRGMQGRTPDDAWIDEGLATAAEYLYLGHHLQDRIDWFNEDRYKTIAKGNNFFVWDGYWEGNKNIKPPEIDQLSNYATAYLFFQWLRIHSSNDREIYREIINHQYGDYRAVTTVAANRFSPAIGNNWETLLRTWFAANFYGNKTGLNGYKGEIRTSIKYTESAAHSAALYPGEGVYSKLPETRNLPGDGYIRYAGFKAGYPENTSGSYQTDWSLLTFNANPDIGGSSESGHVNNIADGTETGVIAHNEAAASALAFEGKKLPTLWQWDSAAAAFDRARREAAKAGDTGLREQFLFRRRGR